MGINTGLVDKWKHWAYLKLYKPLVVVRVDSGRFRCQHLTPLNTLLPNTWNLIIFFALWILAISKIFWHNKALSYWSNIKSSLQENTFSKVDLYGLNLQAINLSSKRVREVDERDVERWTKCRVVSRWLDQVAELSIKSIAETRKSCRMWAGVVCW